MTTGLTSNRFELVNGFYVPFDEDRDDVTPVIARAMALLGEHGRDVPTTEPDDQDTDEPTADHLVDRHTVIRGQARARTQIVLQRLAELNPTEYEDWTFQDLAEALGQDGVTARKSDGVMVIRAADITRALTERDEAGDDDDE